MRKREERGGKLEELGDLVLKIAMNGRFLVRKFLFKWSKDVGSFLMFFLF